MRIVHAEERHIATNPQAQNYLQDFLDDMVDLFTGFNQGHLCKYYFTTEFGAKLWDQIVSEKNSYYVHYAEQTLIKNALVELPQLLPRTLPIIDLGPGSITSVKDFAVPLLKSLESRKYVPVDLSDDFLAAAKSVRHLLPCEIDPQRIDFMTPQTTTLTDEPSLVTLTGVTIGNISGSPNRVRSFEAVVDLLKSFARMSNDGWLLISVDANCDAEKATAMYDTKLFADFFPHVLHHMVDVLPVYGFDPHAFDYKPLWHPQCHLVTHTVISNKHQKFTLGDYSLSIEEGQRFHLGNSFKYMPQDFEQYATKAGFEVIKRWDHETPMKLYLLKCRGTAEQTARSSQTRIAAA